MALTLSGSVAAVPRKTYSALRVKPPKPVGDYVWDEASWSWKPIQTPAPAQSGSSLIRAKTVSADMGTSTPAPAASRVAEPLQWGPPSEPPSPTPSPKTVEQRREEERQSTAPPPPAPANQQGGQTVAPAPPPAQPAPPTPVNQQGGQVVPTAPTSTITPIQRTAARVAYKDSLGRFPTEQEIVDWVATGKVSRKEAPPGAPPGGNIPAPNTPYDPMRDRGTNPGPGYVWNASREEWVKAPVVAPTPKLPPSDVTENLPPLPPEWEYGPGGKPRRVGDTGQDVYASENRGNPPSAAHVWDEATSSWVLPQQYRADPMIDKTKSPGPGYVWSVQQGRWVQGVVSSESDRSGATLQDAPHGATGDEQDAVDVVVQPYTPEPSGPAKTVPPSSQDMYDARLRIGEALAAGEEPSQEDIVAGYGNDLQAYLAYKQQVLDQASVKESVPGEDEEQAPANQQGGQVVSPPEDPDSGEKEGFSSEIDDDMLRRNGWTEEQIGELHLTEEEGGDWRERAQDILVGNRVYDPTSGRYVSEERFALGDPVFEGDDGSGVYEGEDGQITVVGDDGEEITDPTERLPVLEQTIDTIANSDEATEILRTQGIDAYMAYVDEQALRLQGAKVLAEGGYDAFSEWVKGREGDTGGVDVLGDVLGTAMDEATRGVKAAVADMVDALGYDPDEERTARRALIDADAEEARLRLARQFAVDPEGSLGGGAQRAVEILEKERLRQYAAIDAEISGKTNEIRQSNLAAATSTLATMAGIDQNDAQLNETTRQFDGTLQQRINEFAKTHGLNDLQTQAVVKQIYSEIGNSTRQISAQIGQEWAGVLGFAGSESGSVGAQDLGIRLVDPTGRMPDAELRRTPDYAAARGSYEALTGTALSDTDALRLLRGDSVQTSSMPTMEARKLAASVTQGSLDRIAKYDAIAKEHGLDTAKFNEATEQADKAWDLEIGNVAQAFGMDNWKFRGELMTYESVVDAGESESVAATNAAASLGVSVGTFLQAKDQFDTRYGNALKQQAFQLGIGEEQYARAQKSADRVDRLQAATLASLFAKGSEEHDWYFDEENVPRNAKNLAWARPVLDEFFGEQIRPPTTVDKFGKEIPTTYTQTPEQAVEALLSDESSSQVVGDMRQRIASRVGALATESDWRNFLVGYVTSRRDNKPMVKGVSSLTTDWYKDMDPNTMNALLQIAGMSPAAQYAPVQAPWWESLVTGAFGAAGQLASNPAAVTALF